MKACLPKKGKNVEQKKIDAQTAFFHELLETCSDNCQKRLRFFEVWVQYIKDGYMTQHSGQDPHKVLFDYEKPTDEDLTDPGSTMPL